MAPDSQMKGADIDLMNIVFAGLTLTHIPFPYNLLFAGVLNISACQSGAPVFVSQPHFLNGDFYKDTVIGMSPDEGLHNTFIDVEPVGGAQLRY